MTFLRALFAWLIAPVSAEREFFVFWGETEDLDSRRKLMRSGCEIVSARSQDEARAKFAELKPKAIINRVAWFE